MQTNKIIQIIILLLLMLLSMAAVSTLLEVKDQTRNLILGIGLFVALLSFLWRDSPLDAKLLFILVLGYALGGKGFAHVSLVEPIYIGEITLLFCVLGFAVRPRQMCLFETPIHKCIWVYLIYAGIHLIVDFESYRLLAIRDSSMAYYALYFVTAYSLFHNDRVMRTFGRAIKIAFGLSVFSMAYAISTIDREFPGFFPHVDSYIPLCAGGVLYCLIIGIEQKKILHLVFACLVALAVSSTKTAALLALAAVVVSSIVYGRIGKLIMPGIIIGLMGIVALCVVAIADVDTALNLISGGETAETIGIQGGEFVGFSGTTQWRWLWWSVICSDTLQLAPFWGQGFGADITGPFLEAWLGPAHADPAGYARYPHNAMITNFGRLGFIGLTIFCILFIAIGLFALKFCSRYFCDPQRRDADIICFGVVVAGMVNATLQATYEVPYGAVIHWTCLAYMAARFYLPASELTHSTEDEIEAQH